MTPGEIKGYLKQLTLRKDITEEEREALYLAIEAVKLVIAMDDDPFVKAIMEIKHDKNTSGAVIAPDDVVRIAEPNTGWEG